MFFIMGEKSWHDHRGVVGDFCPACDRPRAFTVSDFYTATHIYFVTISRWTFKARIRVCWGCGATFYAKLKDYDELLDEDEAEDLTLTQIVRRTNSPLAEWMASRKGMGSRTAADRRSQRELQDTDDEDL